MRSPGTRDAPTPLPTAPNPPEATSGTTWSALGHLPTSRLPLVQTGASGARSLEDLQASVRGQATHVATRSATEQPRRRAESHPTRPAPSSGASRGRHGHR